MLSCILHMPNFSRMHAGSTSHFFSPCLQIIRFRVSVTQKLALFACTDLRMIHKLVQKKKLIVKFHQLALWLCFWADVSPLSFQPSNQSSPDKIKPRLVFFSHFSRKYVKWAVTCVDFGWFGNRFNALFLTERLKSAVWVVCFQFLTRKS